jgi:3-hydroxy-D-aspartate aldolase
MTSTPNLNQFIQSTVSNLDLAPILLDEPSSIDDLPTPALIIDLDVFERNLNKMQSHVNEHGMGLRCHTKMHKSPIIAKQQIELGAIGICCATVSEAEVMAAAGIDNILITSPVVTDDKLRRVETLAEKVAGLQIVVDHIQGATRLNELAGEREIHVLIDLDPGMGRTGVEPGAPALALAEHVHLQCSRLQFDGLQMYIGNCMHVQGFEARKSKYQHLLQKGVETRALIEANDIEVKVFSGGGTGTYDMEPALGVLTDIQAGSYAFMDVEYRDIGGQDNDQIFGDFEPSLFVLATAISQPQSRLITMDAGIKCLATDTSHPEFRDIEGVVYHFGGDEHGIVQLNNPSKEIKLGDRLPIITPHCDPTVNLFDYYYPHRAGEVNEIWPISARGRSQ